MKSRLAVTFLAALAACTDTADVSEPSDGPDDRFLVADKADGSIADAREAAAVLAFVNGADLPTLDDEVGLDARAAKNIVAHRDGPDAARGTADDDRFDTLEELDAVKYVGAASFTALLSWVRDEGLVAPPPGSDHPCLIISEYVEGRENYNKAVEVMNCGGGPLSLADFGVCLVRGSDKQCTLTAPLGDRLLAPGDVIVGCRSKVGTFNDPLEPLRSTCETELRGVATWDGDDRVMIVRLSDGVPTDMLGRPGYRPPNYPWEDVVLRRCDPKPVTDTSEFYREGEHFTRHRRGELGDLGKPPALTGCSVN